MTKSAAPKQDYWSFVKRQFKKNKRALFSLYLMLGLVLLAIFADFIANDKPIYAKYNGTSYFPVFKEYQVDLGGKWQKELLHVDWYSLPLESSIWPIVPFKANTLDSKLTYSEPMSTSSLNNKKHFFGTDGSGRDLLAGLIHGTRIAFMVGLVSMSITFIIGIFMGGLAGFWGDHGLYISRAQIITTCIGLLVAFYYGWLMRSYTLGEALGDNFLSFCGELFISLVVFCGICVLFFQLGKLARIGSWLSQAVAIPLDILITRLIEIIVSVPTLILIMSVVAITKPSLINVMAIIGLTGWTGIARFVRAELLRVRSLEYIEASEALGYSKIRSFVKHALPNSLSPVFITLAFGMAGAILTESFLSFLGIGVPLETITWGRLLKEAEGSYRSWWLAVFPGSAIFITVTLFNLIGEGITDALDPKKQQ